MTVPVGAPLPGDVTLIVAVNVTDWPDVEGLADDVSAVDVAAWLTFWLRADDVLVVKLASPL